MTTGIKAEDERALFIHQVSIFLDDDDDDDGETFVSFYCRAFFILTNPFFCSISDDPTPRQCCEFSSVLFQFQEQELDFLRLRLRLCILSVYLSFLGQHG